MRRILLSERACVSFLTNRRPRRTSRGHEAIHHMAYKFESEKRAHDSASRPTHFTPRTISDNGQQVTASSTLYRLDIRALPDALFFGSESEIGMDIEDPNVVSVQTEDLFALIRTALIEKGVAGAETARKRYRFMSKKDSEVRLQLALVSVDQVAADDLKMREATVAQVVTPLVSDLISGENLWEQAEGRTDSGYTPVVQEQVREFQRKHGGKKAAERVEIKVGEHTCASIVGGRWPTVEHEEVPDKFFDVVAHCNGWLSDKRLVYLHVVDGDDKVTKKLEALFDQFRHQDLIRDSAGRPEMKLHAKIRVETNSKGEKLHVESLTVHHKAEESFDLQSY